MNPVEFIEEWLTRYQVSFGAMWAYFGEQPWWLCFLAAFGVFDIIGSAWLFIWLHSRTEEEYEDIQRKYFNDGP